MRFRSQRLGADKRTTWGDPKTDQASPPADRDPEATRRDPHALEGRSPRRRRRRGRPVGPRPGALVNQPARHEGLRARRSRWSRSPTSGARSARASRHAAAAGGLHRHRQGAPGVSQPAARVAASLPSRRAGRRCARVIRAILADATTSSPTERQAPMRFRPRRRGETRSAAFQRCLGSGRAANPRAGGSGQPRHQRHARVHHRPDRPRRDQAEDGALHQRRPAVRCSRPLSAPLPPANSREAKPALSSSLTMAKACRAEHGVSD